MSSELQQKRQAKGTFIQLSHGVTHYEYLPGERKGCVVLLSGGTVPMWSWDLQVAALRKAGYGTLRYNYFGRGLSDRPRAPYDPPFFQKQLRELIDGLAPPDPLFLVGHSFGGAMAALYTADHPKRVKRLVFLAPLIDGVEYKTPFRLVRIPLLGRLLMRHLIMPRIVLRATGYFKKIPERSEEYTRGFLEQVEIEGFERSLYLMMRGRALGNYQEVYSRLGEQGREALLFWGTEDGDMSRDKMEDVIRRLKRVRFEVLPGVGHSSNFEAAERVNGVMLEYLGEG